MAVPYQCRRKEGGIAGEPATKSWSVFSRRSAALHSSSLRPQMKMNLVYSSECCKTSPGFDQLNSVLLFRWE